MRVSYGDNLESFFDINLPDDVREVVIKKGYGDPDWVYGVVSHDQDRS